MERLEAPGSPVDAADDDHPAPHRRVGRTRLPGLDGLRGLAVAAVVAYHLGHLSGGFLGVDVFFVLSGYLVTSLALGEIAGSGRLGLRAFWGRRVRRLAPALFAMVPVVVAATIAIGRDRATLDRLGWDSVATLSWWMNWRQAFGDDGGYWDPSPSLFRHAWSLSIEEQFYATWPLVLVAVIVAFGARRAPRAVGLVAGALAAASAAWSVVLAHRVADADLSRVYLGTDTRIVAPLVGCTLAALLHRSDRRGFLGSPSNKSGGTRAAGEDPDWSRVIAPMAGAVALCVLAILFATVEVDDPALYRTGLLPAVSVLAALALVGARSMTRIDPVTGWLGRRSYAIYLWSWPIQILLLQHDPEIGRARLAVVTVLASLVLAEVSWRLLEHPVQRRTSWASRRPMRTAAGVALSLGAIAAIAVPFGRHDPAGFVEAPSADDALERSRQAPESVPQGPGPTRQRVAIFGDSVAFTVAFHAPWPGSIPGIRSIDGQGVIGCGLLSSAGFDGLEYGGANWAPPPEVCALQDEMEAEALAREPDVVLLFSGAWEYPGTRTPDGTVLGARSDDYADAIVDELLAAAAKADEVGALMMFVSFACPGSDDDAPARRNPEFLRWYDGVLHRAAREAREAGHRATVLEPTDAVCVDADPAGAPTPEKDVAFNHEVHVQDPEGAAWAWRVWLGPAIVEATSAD